MLDQWVVGQGRKKEEGGVKEGEPDNCGCSGRQRVV